LYRDRLETAAKSATSKFPNALHIDASGPIAGSVIETSAKTTDFFAQHTSSVNQGLSEAVTPADESELSELSESEPEVGEPDETKPIEASSEVIEKTIAPIPKPNETPVDKKPLTAKEKFVGEPKVTSELTKNTYKPLLSNKKNVTKKGGVWSFNEIL
jgi:hypothetical protein